MTNKLGVKVELWVELEWRKKKRKNTWGESERRQTERIPENPNPVKYK